MSVLYPVEQLGRPGSQAAALPFLLEPLLFDLWFFAVPGEPPLAFFFDSWGVPARIKGLSSLSFQGKIVF